MVWNQKRERSIIHKGCNYGDEDGFYVNFYDNFSIAAGQELGLSRRKIII
jgi:hypothetical protein